MLQPRVGPLPVDLQDDLLEAAEVGRARREHVGLPPLALGVAPVHLVAGRRRTGPPPGRRCRPGSPGPRPCRRWGPSGGAAPRGAVRAPRPAPRPPPPPPAGTRASRGPVPPSPACAPPPPDGAPPGTGGTGRRPPRAQRADAPGRAGATGRRRPRGRTAPGSALRSVPRCRGVVRAWHGHYRRGGSTLSAIAASFRAPAGPSAVKPTAGLKRPRCAAEACAGRPTISSGNR